jgi:hypothetical protein
MRAIHRRQNTPPASAVASPVRFERDPVSDTETDVERIHDADRMLP